MPRAIDALKNDPKGQDAWKELLSKLTKAEEYLSLPKDTGVFPIDYTMPKNNYVPPEVSQDIYVRQCYIDFYKKLSKTLRVTTVLSGRPGMGKSLFGVYYVFRKLMELLTDSNRKQPVILVYVVSYTLVKIRIPLGEPDPKVEMERIDNSAKWLQYLESDQELGEQVFANINPTNMKLAENVAAGMNDVAIRTSLYLCICSPGIVASDTTDKKSASKLFGNCSKPTMTPWTKCEMEELLKMYVKINSMSLAVQTGFQQDMADMLTSGNPGAKEADPHHFFADLTYAAFGKTQQEDAFRLYKFLCSLDGQVSDNQTKFDQYLQREPMVNANFQLIVRRVLDYRCEVVGYSIRLILEGNVKDRLMEHYEKKDTCKLLKLFSDFQYKNDRHLNLFATIIGDEVPGNMVVSKMIAVRKIITFLKDQLENKNLKHCLEWLAHEQLCHEAFAPREQLDLTFKFKISRCSEKHKIRTFMLQHWFETDSLKKCFTSGVDQLKDDCYYRCCKDQAVMDVLLYTNRKIRRLTSANGKKIFLIQATVSERHSVKPKS